MLLLISYQLFPFEGKNISFMYALGINAWRKYILRIRSSAECYNPQEEVWELRVWEFSVAFVDDVVRVQCAGGTLMGKNTKAEELLRLQTI